MLLGCEELQSNSNRQKKPAASSSYRQSTKVHATDRPADDRNQLLPAAAEGPVKVYIGTQFITLGLCQQNALVK